MFRLFKSKITRRNEAWIYFHAELVRQSIQTVYILETALGESAVPQRIQDRIFSNTFAGYLFGFAEVIVNELSPDNPTHDKYSRMFFNAVMTKRGGEWIQSKKNAYTTSRSVDYESGFHDGVHDALDFITAKEPATLTRLGKYFICHKELAA